MLFFFFFQAEDGIRDSSVTEVQTCALPISLANRATSVMYEGTPETPHRGRWWEIVEKYGVTILYTAPTVIRTFMEWGEDVPQDFDLTSLRVLGSVGEPINPEAWLWYHEHIGGGRCPIVDTWWQTET